MAAKKSMATRRAARKAYEKAKKKPLGEGSRFAAIEASAKAGGARNPAAVAAAAGRKAHGQKSMTRYSKIGKSAAKKSGRKK